MIPRLCHHERGDRSGLNRDGTDAGNRLGHARRQHKSDSSGPNIITYRVEASLAAYEPRFIAAFSIYESFLNVDFVNFADFKSTHPTATTLTSD